MWCPKFEYEVYPPSAYLEWLIKHPEYLRWPTTKKGKRRDYSSKTKLKRKLLVDKRKRYIQREALQLLQDKPGAKKKWWIFEGITKVDCALFAENVTVFVEGKRTETGLEQPTDWDPNRLQIFRNLDCLRELVSPSDNFYMLLIVEKTNDELLDKARKLDKNFLAAKKSWPHLSTQQVKELWSHYLGFTTWQQIVKKFPGLDLPDTRDQAETKGLTGS